MFRTQGDKRRAHCRATHRCHGRAGHGCRASQHDLDCHGQSYNGQVCRRSHGQGCQCQRFCNGRNCASGSGTCGCDFTACLNSGWGLGALVAGGLVVLDEIEDNEIIEDLEEEIEDILDDWEEEVQVEFDRTISISIRATADNQSSKVRTNLVDALAALAAAPKTLTFTKVRPFQDISANGDGSVLAVVDNAPLVFRTYGIQGRTYLKRDSITATLTGYGFAEDATVVVTAFVDGKQLAESSMPTALPSVPVAWAPGYLNTSSALTRSLVYENENRQLTVAIGDWVSTNPRTETAYGPIGTWNVSKVAEFTGVFSNVPNNFTGTGLDDISAWDTGSALGMSFMFFNAPQFNGQISGWNTKRCINFTGMFENASAFDQDISQWIVSANATTQGGNAIGPNFSRTFLDTGITTANATSISTSWQRQTENFANPFNSYTTGLP